MNNSSGTIYRGVGVTNGKARGKIRFLKREDDKGTSAAVTSKEEELERYERARRKALEDTKDIVCRVRSRLGDEEAQIFEIHEMLLEDEDFISLVVREINSGKSAEESVRFAADAFKGILSAIDDEYLSARQGDIGDVSARIIKNLSGGVAEFDGLDTEPYILVADDLTPSETVQLELERIAGFVTFRGTPSSHTAILARSMGIPAVVGVGRVDSAFQSAEGLLDAEKGTFTASPTNEQIREFESERKKGNKIAREHDLYLRSVMNKPAVTRSGHRILIYANIGSEVEVSSAISNGAEGIGLLRSEFLYLARDSYPSEEELFSAYRNIAIKMQGKRVIIRTLDIGADKQIPYFRLPKEENPALGYRAIRICLDRQELFKSQLRAILRSSAFGCVALMLPMITSVDEVREAKSLIDECKRELLTQGVKFDDKIELGIMIETPAAAIMSRELAGEVDFFSVGTNDLTQYTLAADRQNPLLTRLCETNAEPVLRLIKMATEAIHQRGGWIGVCGEMAADLNRTKELADMGVDELSVASPYLLGVRRKVSEC